MKLVLFNLGIIFLLTGCASTALDKLIIGSWKVSQFEISDPNVPKEVQEYAASLSESVQYIFMDDGSYTIVSSSLPKGKRGIWTYRSSTDDIVLEMQNEAPSIIKIVEIKRDKLLCESATSPAGKVSFTLSRISK